MSGARKLVVVQRKVAAARLAAYEDAWLRFRDAAARAGANAWRFRSAHCDRLFLEFLEFSAQVDPRDELPVANAGGVLESFAPGDSTEWNEDNPS